MTVHSCSNEFDVGVMVSTGLCRLIPGFSTKGQLTAISNSIIIASLVILDI